MKKNAQEDGQGNLKREEPGLELAALTSAEGGYPSRSNTLSAAKVAQMKLDERRRIEQLQVHFPNAKVL